MLLSDRAQFALARRLRGNEAVSLGEVFTFLSGLYFRGKLAYANTFATDWERVLVITPTRGLVPATTPVSLGDLREFAEVDIAEDDPRYRKPLERDLKRLVRRLTPECDVVLLGSIATGKYVSVMLEILRRAVAFPGGLCWPRRHEPRRAPPAQRRRSDGARLYPGARRGAKREATAKAGAAAVFVAQASCLWGDRAPCPAFQMQRARRPLSPQPTRLCYFYGMPLAPPIPPMEARSVDEIPSGEGWQYEPKWDGFRCLAFRDGDEIYLQSKAGQPLARYFPDVVRALCELKARQFVLDGELVIPIDGALSFDELQLRLHPAASRVNKLAAAHPAMLVIFDLLAGADGESLLAQPLEKRRAVLEKFATKFFPNEKRIRLSPATTDLCQAEKWFQKVGGDLDGIIAKRVEAAYASGERTAMVKIKQIRTVDCVVGGFRYASGAKVVGSLLLGLYDDEGLLHHVGFTSAFKASEKPALTKKFEALKKAPGFTGAAPGGPSRWSTERSAKWEPVDPKVVVEVTYDHFTGGRFRHGTKIVRWRKNKAPRQCTLDQVEHREGKSLALI